MRNEESVGWTTVLVTLASVLLGGWWLHATLWSRAWSAPSRGPVEWTITAGADGSRQPTAQPGDLWVFEVFADGRVLRKDEVQRTGPWRQEGGGHRPSLLHFAGTPTATLSFVAERALVRFGRSPWHGSAQVAGGGATATVDCRAPDEGSTWVELPLAAPPGWGLPVVLGASLLGWLVVRPWRSRRRVERLLLRVLVAAHVAAGATLPVDVHTDSLGYLPCLDSVLLQGQPSYFPPGYGLFQWAADLVPGMALGAALVWSQHALMVVSLLCLWRFVASFLGWAGGNLFLALATWSAVPLLTPQMAMSEVMAFAAITFAVLGVDRFVRGGGGRGSLVAAGVSLALGVLARVVPLAAAGPAMALLLLALPDWRSRWRAAALTFGVAGGFVLLPMAWCGLHGKGFSLSDSAGRHLYNRVVYEQKLLDEQAPVTQAVRQLLPDTDLCNTWHWDLMDKIVATPAAAHAIFLIDAVAIEALRSAPLAYLAFTFPHTWHNLVAAPRDMLLLSATTPHHDARFEVEPVAGLGAPALAAAHQLNAAHAAAWPWCCWLAVGGCLLLPFCRGPRRALAIAWLPVGYLFATSLVEYFLPRYNLGIAPFVVAVALVPFSLWRRRSDEVPA